MHCVYHSRLVILSVSPGLFRQRQRDRFQPHLACAVYLIPLMFLPPSPDCLCLYTTTTLIPFSLLRHGPGRIHVLADYSPLNLLILFCFSIPFICWFEGCLYVYRIPFPLLVSFTLCRE